jgi:transforming growth factor-beta-induced protein
MRTKRTISTLAAATAVAVAAVGPASASAHPASPKKDIVETAVAAGKFDTLTTLLKKAGLVKALKGEARHTVFAPTDKAFSKVPKATLDARAKDKAKLRAVLLYHVANGKLPAAKVVKRHSIRTLNGQRVHVRVRDGKVFVGGARVVTPDIAASNGVIHVINRVLIPR